MKTSYFVLNQIPAQSIISFNLRSQTF